ncbi:Superkiller protein 3 [Tulasnella sp. 418]|nr:Superkiller protein 3 [Tulasnella sp. 418]
MSAALVKAKLKAAREAIARKDFQTARDASEQILSYDPSNYNGNVFLGLSLSELGEHDKAEEAYRSATSSNPDQPLAWQGLAKFYERAEQWDQLAKTLSQLMELFRKADDATKCAENLQKLIDLRRRQGTKQELCDSLRLLLPGSPFYAILSSLPPPDPTAPASTTTYLIQEAIYNSLPILQELLSIEEKQEEDFIKTEIEKRRLRLNAPPLAILKQDVRREIFSVSKIPELYEEIMNHPNTPDDSRRAIESKLFRHKLEHLFALQDNEKEGSKKRQLREEVEGMINGVILLKIADELAWTIYLDGEDCSELAGYDAENFQRFLRIFPYHPFALTVQGILVYLGFDLNDKEDDDGDKDKVDGPTHNVEIPDPVDLILRGFDEAKDSILAHRATSQIYLDDKDYENAIQVAEAGLNLVRRNEANFGRPLSQVKNAFNIIIATSLVHLHPPKHHLKALGLLQKLLADDPDNIPSLMARGYILEHAQKWQEAIGVFDQVIKLLGMNDLGVGLEAREERAWCRMHESPSQRSIGNEELKEVISALETLEGREEEKAKARWRVGWSLWNMGGENRGESYSYFISALKDLSTFAPAFTSLGIYYLEHAAPPDPVRASKCFQKAFELDAREGEAARRLAEGFAEDREWDLVEVVARRTIEGEGGIEGGQSGSTNDAISNKRYFPTNAWAWKALGVVELNKGNFTEAVQALQITLRADDKDFQSLLRLGEAYAKAGRHVASLKALAHAKELAPPEDWTCHYVTGDVLRQLQHYDEAIAAFERILETIGEEPGVLIALAQTCLENGRSQRSSGFHARAEESFIRCISTGLNVASNHPGFRNMGWKAAGDGLWELGARAELADENGAKATLLSLAETLKIARSETSSQSSNDQGTIPGLDFIIQNLHQAGPTGRWSLALAAAVAQFRLEKSNSENGSQDAISAFDLAITSSRLIKSSVPDLLFPQEADTIRKNEWENSVMERAIALTQSAIKSEPSNVTYWNALGVLCIERDLKLAQHAFIRAIEIDSKNPASWTNLGLLYLTHSDGELAKEAFSKAQTLNPDYVLAWVGQALIHENQANYREAATVLEHAIGISPDVVSIDSLMKANIYSPIISPKPTWNTPLVHSPDFPKYKVVSHSHLQRSSSRHSLYWIVMSNNVLWTPRHYTFSL